MSSAIKAIKPLGFPWETQDPFLFCVHHLDRYPSGNDDMSVDRNELSGRQIGQDFQIKDGWRMYHGQKIPGFPYHPHRGFETVTIGKQGFVDHSDSLGGAGRFSANDVQWMTAGKGIQHSEMFPLFHTDRENTLEIFQIWLNLPAKSKMCEPHFKMLWAEDIPVIAHEDEDGRKTTVDLIAGSLSGKTAPDPTPDSWAADPSNGVMILTIKMEANAKWTLPAADPSANRTLYCYSGNHVIVDGEQLDQGKLAQLYADKEVEIFNGDTDAYLVVLQGKPINEPVAQYGPFVMNSEREIQEAFAEFRETQFGGWPWPQQEQTHGRDKGRFAKHADGREEVRN